MLEISMSPPQNHRFLKLYGSQINNNLLFVYLGFTIVLFLTLKKSWEEHNQIEHNMLWP